MKENFFLFKEEFSIIGTKESAIWGINVGGREVPFTGTASAVESFGITAEELAVFAANATSVHFEREVVCVPRSGTKINEKPSTEEIAVLTVRAVADGEVIKSTRISRVLCRW